MAKKSAEDLAKRQKAISVAEFFERNRHLLGFDNKKKALLTTIKEAVDNSLDACEDARVLPEIIVEIIDMGNDRFRVVVEDNGPGIIKKQVPNIFAKLLYGSKFHTMKQQRGQQGIGISAAALYGQLTTGRPVKITSRTSPKKPAYYAELRINTQTNNPEIINDKEIAEWTQDHGTRIEIDLEASYSGGSQSVDAYLKETAIVNPHATIIYTNPKAEQLVFPRVTEELPKEPQEIKPHPYGVEIGIMMKMLKVTPASTLQQFLTTEFSRVGAGTAKEICANARLLPRMKPKDIHMAELEQLMEGIKKTKIIAPSTDCIVPITAEDLEAGLRKEIPAEFYASASRKPDVYKGIPFLVEVAVAYGGNQPGDKTANLLRFANRVPLLYQQSAGAIFKSVIATNWRSYGLSQSSGSLPIGPLTIAVHVASVWPPFTSEAKEAIAHYPEIIKELKLALQEAGRKLGIYVRKKKRLKQQRERVNIFERYIPEIADSIAYLAGEDSEKVKSYLDAMVDQPEVLGIVDVKEKVTEEDKIDITANVEEEEDMI